MKAKKGRISALQTIVAGTKIPGVASRVIIAEFEEAEKIESLRPLERRRLLQVLYLTRALDSFLSEFTILYGLQGGSRSLGGYLKDLETHKVTAIRRLPTRSREFYQKRIVKKRNAYMHEAGFFPSSELEIGTLVNDMHACIAEVASL